MNRGFGLIALLIAVALIAFIISGAKWFTGSGKEGQTSIEAGFEAKDQAEAVKQLIEGRNKELFQNE